MNSALCTIREIAGVLNVHASSAKRRAAKERWPYTEATGRGGKRRLYPLDQLPPEVRTKLARQSLNEKAREASEAGHTEGRAAAITHAIDTAAVQRIKEQGLAKLAHLVGKARDRAESKLELLSMLNIYTRDSGLQPSKALQSFCHLYNHCEIEVPEKIRAFVKHIHPATIYRWRKSLDTEGATGLRGHYGHRKGSSKIDRQPELQKFCIAMLTDFPHTSAANLMDAMRARFADSVIDIPSKRSVERWVASWKDENAQLFTAISNPDEWKNKYMLAMGSASEDITRLNQKWEFDSTPADVMLIDGRHSLIGIIDIWSRRTELLVSKTSKSTAVATTIRRAILNWGVPEVAKTDNGADYVSNHVRRVFDSLDIEQDISNPFSPWEKPHIERFFRTFSHGLMELLPNYIGHNVSDRQAIEARRSFADRLMKKGGEPVEINMTSTELQRFCDRWLESVYHMREHGSLGMSPFQKANSYTGEIRRISDERVLDILLAEAPGDGTRTVRKKGIYIDNIQYIAPELGAYVGMRVKVLHDPDDLGKIYVYGEEGFICVAKSDYAGISRQEVAAVGKQIQKAQVQEAKRKLKASTRKLKTKDIAEEILSRQAEQSESLVEFPRPFAEHTGDAITAAGDTLNFLDTEQDDYIPPVDEAAIQRVQKIMREEQLQDETEEDRFRRWIRLEESNEQACETDQHWKQQYEATSEFRGRKLLYDEFGSTAFQVGK